MPAISSESKLLITGASGYIGAQTLRDLLERGFTVVASARSESSGQSILRVNPEHAKSGKLTYAVVPDITTPGAFDEAVKGVAGVVHIASPVVFDAKDPQDVIRPALEGTLSVMRSAHKSGSVKRFVVTSSVATLARLYALKGFQTLTHTDWNDEATEAVERDGVKSHPGDVYGASKVLAERAARHFVDEHKTFDIVSILPAYALGPWAHDLKSKEELRSSIGLLNTFIFAEKPYPAFNIVDVRDLASLHSLALLTEKASGERILAGPHHVSPLEVYKHIKQHEPPFPGVPDKDPSLKDLPGTWNTSSRATEVFSQAGFKWTPWEETVDLLAAQLSEKGWLTADASFKI